MNEKIILIGGSPRSGKTTFAKSLSNKLGCELISIDDLRKSEIERLGKEESLKRFIFERVYDNNDNFFRNHSAKEILELEIQDAKALWPIIEETIQSKLNQNSPAIVEGVQLFPELLEKYKNNPEIKIFLFYKKDKNLIAEGFHKNEDADDWLLNDTHDPKTFEHVAETFSFYGDFFEREAKKYDFVAINTEENFENKIKQLLDRLG